MDVLLYQVSADWLVFSRGSREALVTSGNLVPTDFMRSPAFLSCACKGSNLTRLRAAIRATDPSSGEGMRL